MVVGFNHNFRYKGSLYHVQTEDGGLKYPQIVTLLFSGGTILSSRKTSYADIVKVHNLEQVVEELMKEQHREMLRQLKDGEFDELIRQRLGGGASPPSPEGAPPGKGSEGGTPPSRNVTALRPAAAPSGDVAAPRGGESLPDAMRTRPPASSPPPAPVSERERKRPEGNLDDLVWSYLTGESDGKS